MKKSLLTLLLISTFSISMKAQMSPQKKDTLLNQAGEQLQSFAKYNNAGYLLTTAGSLVLVVSALTPVKQTVNYVTTTKPNTPLIIIGGALYVFGVGCFLSAPSKVSRAGYLLKLISGQKVEIPISKKPIKNQ